MGASTDALAHPFIMTSTECLQVNMASEDQEIIFSGRQTDSRRYDQPLWPFLRSRMETFGSRVALVTLQ